MNSDSPAARRFIDLATDPLADNAELHLAARSDLSRRIETSPAAAAEALDEASAALETASRQPWRRWVAIALSVVAVGAALLWGATTAMRMVWLSSVVELIGGSGMNEEEAKRFLPQVSDPETRLLLFGGEGATTEEEKWRPLWQSDPSNPVYFANFVAEWKRTHGRVSDELLDEAEKIDPHNGWYLAFAAGSELDGALEKVPRSDAERAAGKAQRFVIKDEGKYQKALGYFNAAAERSMLRDHAAALMAERASALPQSDDMVSNLRNLTYMAGLYSNSIPLRRLGELIAHEADLCAERGDGERFRRLVRQWRWLVEGMNESGGSLVDGLVAKAVVAGPLRNFRNAAGKHGMTDEALHFGTMDDAFEAGRLARGTRKTPDDEAIRNQGSWMASLTLPSVGKQVEFPPLLTKEDLKPGRMADHSIIGRMFAASIAFLLVLAAGFTVLVRFRHGEFGRKLSARLCSLIRPSDWLLMVGAGVIAPLLWFAIVTRFTPFSSRDWTPMFAGGFPMIGQWVSLAMLVFTAGAAAAAWRFDRRTRFLGRAPKSAWFGGFAVLCAALAIPAFGAIPVVTVAGGRPALWTGLGLGGIVLLWWLAGFFGIATGLPNPGSVRRIAISRLLVPVWMVAALVVLGILYVHSLEESHWVGKDNLMRVCPDHLGLSRYEADVTEQLRKELRETISKLPRL